MENHGEDDHVAEFIDPNSLIAMPVEIIEKIFNHLNFTDKLSFSESCSTFNEIFDRRKNLDKVWMDGPESDTLLQLTDTLRPYANLKWNFKNVKKISNLLWDHLAPSLNSVEMTNVDHYFSISNSLLNTLPHFVNLTYLHMNVCYDRVKKDILLNDTRQVNSGLIDMKHLQHLSMDNNMFCYLDGRHINFAETKNLQILIIRGVFENFKGNGITNLISNQNKLKTLHLLNGVSYSIFDTPLNIQSKLEDLKVTEPMLKMYNDYRLNVQQQNNFCDFVNYQDQLKRVKLHLNVAGEKTEKMKRFLEGRLDMPIKVHNIDIFVPSSYNDFVRYRRRYTDYDSVLLSLEDFISHTSSGHQNFEAEEVHMKMNLT